MNIEINHNEIIDLKDFELGWRWKKTHNPNISESEKNQIQPITEIASKRIHKVIKHYEGERFLMENYHQTDWISANQESAEKTERFRIQMESILKPWNEDILINWHRNITLKTTKEIFLRYWTDFLYPSSDDVTLISEKTNWVMFYKHFEVANIWTKK